MGVQLSKGFPAWRSPPSKKIVKFSFTPEPRQKPLGGPTTLRALRHLQLAHKHLATTRILRVAGRTTSERDRPHPGRHSHVAPWCHQLQLGHRHRDGHDSHRSRLQIIVPAAPTKTGQTRDDMSSPAGSQPPPAAPAHTLTGHSPREPQQLLPRDGRIAHGLRLEATIPDTSSANRAQCH